MKKIYKLRNWYPLGDAAKRLTITLGEEVAVTDILLSALENHLTLSWYIRHITAQEVASVTRIPIPDRTNHKLLIHANQEHEFKPMGNYYTEGYKAQGGIEWLYGIHKLEIGLCWAIKDWILSLAVANDCTLVTMEGYFVRDDKGNLYRIMERITDNERIAHGLPPYNSSMSFYDPERFYPSSKFPDVADLGITKTDLETFEALLDSTPKATHPKTEKPLLPKERESLLKLSFGMAKAWHGYDPTRARSNAISQIRSDLERCGVPLDDETIRKYLREGAELLPEMADND